MTWPMAADLGAHFSSRQDFYLNLWILDWVARWLTEPGLALFHTDALYHPVGTGLASQDLTLVQTVLAAPLTLTAGPVVAFHALVLLSFWLAGFATALWVRALTGDGAAGLFAGALYTFAPYHLLYVPQLGMVAIGFLPLFLLADLSFTRAPGVGRAARAGLALAVVGLGAWYYGVNAGLLALAASAARVVRAGRAGPGGRARALRLEAVLYGTCALVLAPVVAQMLPAFLGRSALAGGEEREGMGLVMTAFKGTESTMSLWSFLGWTTLGFAALGARPWRRRAPLLLAAAGFLVLSLGESVELGGVRVPLPYAWLQALPALSALRYPDRFVLVTQLALAALAGHGLVALRARMARPALASALVLLPLLEFWPGPLPRVEAPAPPPVPVAAPGDAGAVLHVPTALTHLDGEQMAMATAHHRPVVGGYLMRRDPDRVEALRAVPGLLPFLQPNARLPDDLAARLRAADVRFVCLARAPWGRAADEPPRAVMLPFSLCGRPFLHERLWPAYARHAQLAQQAAAWEPALTERLGPPIAADARELVWEVPAP